MSENEIFSNNDSLFKKENEQNKNKLVGGYDEDLVINKNYLESLDNIYPYAQVKQASFLTLLQFVKSSSS